MLFWIYFITFWTIGYMVAYTIMRPEILHRRMQPHEKPWWFRYGPPTWNENSTKHAKQHYKAYVPVGIALWLIFFLMAVHAKDVMGR